MNYTLFTEDKCIYYQWMRILNFAFNKVDILTPNFVSTYNFFLPLHTQSEDNKRKELKRIARENLGGQYRISMGAILALGIIPLAAELPFSMLQNSVQPIGQTIIFYIADFLISLITFLLSAGVIYFHLHIARRQKPALGMVFYAFKNHPDRFLLAGILLTLLMVLAAVPAGLGILLYYITEKSVLAIVRLVILAALSVLLIAFVQLQYALTVYLMLDHAESGVIEALRTSRKMMKGNRKRLLYQFFSRHYWCVHFLRLSLNHLADRSLCLNHSYTQLIVQAGLLF